MIRLLLAKKSQLLCLLSGIIIGYITTSTYLDSYNVNMIQADYPGLSETEISFLKQHFAEPEEDELNSVWDGFDTDSTEDTYQQMPIEFDDENQHHDDDHIAREMYSRVRVLCWVMTTPDNLKTKAIHVRNTWGKRCNTLLFISDEDDPSFPAISVGAQTGRKYLPDKTIKAFDYIYKHHYHDADWFLKADDDTYIIMENLRYLLSAHKPNESVYFGHHFQYYIKQGYFSGGAGYVLSKESLRRFGNRRADLCTKTAGPEDVYFGLCMQSLGVETGYSRDKLGRNRFHALSPNHHLNQMFPEWYNKFNKYNDSGGIDSMSDYPISFHYIKPSVMYVLEFFTYHASVYGVVRGVQDLNPEDTRAG